MKLSTGLRDHLLTAGDFQSGVDGGAIFIYDGAEPATADAALSGNTLLCVISNDAAGTGITMAAAAASGVLGKNTAEIWRGLIVANGTASFYRFQGLLDDGTLSTTNKRLQGTVGVVAADLIFSSVNFVASNYKNIDSFNVAMPTA
ncbi:MAG: hypothetical protein AB7E55_36025 [Pigmentiphaga sp.]